MILTEQDLASFESSPLGCWVQDVERSRVVWANEAALRLLRAASREALYARDLTPKSAATATRLETYLARVKAGEELTTQATVAVDGVPITWLARLRAFAAGDGRTLLFFEARDMSEWACPESLRMLDAARHAMAPLALYSHLGEALEQNAAFTRVFGGRIEGGVRLPELFADLAEYQLAHMQLNATGTFRGRVWIRTGAGDRWHMLLATRLMDPVDGDRAVLIELVDIADQVETEERARGAESLLQAIADEFAQPVAYILADRTYRFVNKTYCNWVARPREAILGRTIARIAGKDADAHWERHWPALARGERASYERRAIYPGHGERWISVDMIPQFSDSGGVDGAFVMGYDIHALKIAESELKSSQHRLATIAERLPLGVATVDREMRVRFANPVFCRWFGVRPDSVVGRHAAEVVGAEVVEQTVDYRARALAGETVQFRRSAVLDGQKRWVDCTLGPLADAEGAIEGLVAVYTDVTRRVEARDALNRVQGELASHLANTPLSVMQLDCDRRVLQWTGRASEVFGWTLEQALGRTLVELGLFEEGEIAAFDYELLALDGGRAERFAASFRNVRRDRAGLHCEWYGSVVRDDDGAVSSYLLLVEDVSARVNAERHLQYVATHDVLTGFANRARFEDRLGSEISRAHRTSGALAIILIDLDRFMYVNETLGHACGDLVLQEAARRLESVALEGELIARTGADEFMMLADLSAPGRTAETVAAAVTGQFQHAFEVGGREIVITASVGVALYPEDASNEADLIRKADWALYCAKDAGRNLVQFYSRVQERMAPRRLLVEADLRRALERAQLELHYQPKLHLASRRITGTEALVRWRHPERGLIAPDQFIPFAEECGLIVELGRWVIEEACRQCAAWRRAGGTVPIQVAINLSAVQLRRPELAGEILNALDRHGLPGAALVVEVTETSVVSDPLLAKLTLETLRDHGVPAAIDDFGKGFSSLAQLKRLPIDSLKIDSSFVRDVVVDRESTAIVQAIIGLGHNLDMKVVAEGVETPEQLAFLEQHGCDEAQGYLIARPMAASEVATFLGATPAGGVPSMRPEQPLEAG